MISDQDVTKLKKTFATKADLAKTDRKVDALQEQVGNLTVEVGEIKDTLGSMRNTLDTVAGALFDLRNENRFGSVILNRHDNQIQQLAKHTGASISES